MKKKNLWLEAIDLTLFDGAGAGDGSGGTAATGGSMGETTGTVPGPTRRGKSGEYDNVLFGKQPDAVTTAEGADEKDDASDAGKNSEPVQEQAAEKTLEERKKAFRDLINGEYKDLYTEETQRIINRRFSDAKTKEAQLEKQQPLMNLLMDRYGITDGDVDKLQRAVENDDVLWDEAAADAGLSVEQYKAMQKLERENAQFRQRQEEAQRQEAVQRQISAWEQEGQQVKARYPGFDLMTETQNPRFMQMLRSGVPMQTAYEAAHMDEIMTEARQQTAASTEKKVVDSVRARGSRPKENGTSSQSAFTVKDDVSKLSRKDRAEIARRAARGERISF